MIPPRKVKVLSREKRYEDLMKTIEKDHSVELLDEYEKLEIEKSYYN